MPYVVFYLKYLSVMKLITPNESGFIRYSLTNLKSFDLSISKLYPDVLSLTIIHDRP